jgi:hypothetical protein
MMFDIALVAFPVLRLNLRLWSAAYFNAPAIAIPATIPAPIPFAKFIAFFIFFTPFLKLYNIIIA